MFEAITYTRVRGLRFWGKYFLQLRGLTFDATVALDFAFAFSRSFWVRVDDLHVIFLGNVGPSCEKELVQSHCLYMFTLHFVQRLNDIQQDFAGYKF